MKLTIADIKAACDAMERRRVWDDENPPGSKNNPFILHPAHVKRIKELQEELGISRYSFE